MMSSPRSMGAESSISPGAVVVVGVGVLHRQLGHVVDVEVVRLPVAGAVAVELAVLDEDLAAGVVAGEDAVLVVAEEASAHGQVGPLLANAGAVRRRRCGSAPRQARPRS